MQEVGGRAGARERRRDLLADDARLAHAGEDDTSATIAEQFHGAIESLVEAIGKREHRGGFGLEHLARERTVDHEDGRLFNTGVGCLTTASISTRRRSS